MSLLLDSSQKHKKYVKKVGLNLNSTATTNTNSSKD